MSLPGQRLEAAWGSGFTTPEGSRTWSDLTGDLKLEPGIDIVRGRNNQQGAVQPSNLNATLENIEGQYTPEKTGGANYPNVKRSVPVRVTQRDESNYGAGNLLTANQASFETSIADWSVDGLGTVAALVTGSFRSVDGANSMRLTWPTSASTKFATTIITGLVKGRTYTLSGYIYVGTGPAVRLGMVTASVNTPFTSTTGSFQRLSVTFVATASTDIVVIGCPSATTAGQQVWVDAIQLDEGAVLGAFTTTPPVIRTRGLFYADAWTLGWPTGGDEQAITTLTAVSRRARLGKGAALNAPFRAAVLAANPEVYWPMDEVGVTDRAGQYVFRDITNNPALPNETEAIAAFVLDPTVVSIYLGDGTEGPTDEASLVKLKATTDPANPDWQHYIGGGGSMKFGTNLAGVGASFVMLARVNPTLLGSDSVDLARLFTHVTGQLGDEVRFGLGNTGLDRFVYVAAVRRDIAGAILEQTTWFFATTHEANQAAYDLAIDGEIHCYEVDISATAASIYIDGVNVANTSTLGTPLNGPFRSIAMAPRTLFADTWIGHAAGYDFVLSGAQTLATAAAGSSASETISDRVTRIVGYLGVPAAEVDVETSYAAPLGRQAEKGNSGVTVLDAVAESTRGVLYDTREGHLAMQARNHRYNAVSAFTLSVLADEVEADLQPVLDGEGLINRVTVERVGSTNVGILVEDTASQAQEGIEDAGTVSVVTAEDTEAEAYGYNLIARSATARMRIVSVTVDVTDLSSAQRTAVLGADIGTLFTLTNLPRQAPASTVQLFIEGYHEVIAKKHTITFNTSPGTLDSPIFIPDDPVFGLLDVGNLIAF